MTQYILNVFDGPERVGTVEYEPLEERFSFKYDDTWRAARHSYSISPHIGVNAAPPPSSAVRRFLENLLPEGRALDIVATTHQVSRNNLYALIRELGRETSGALSFLPGDSTPADEASISREVGREELRQRINSRAEIPFAVWDGRVRLSIAGYQDKLAVYQDDGRMYLVEGRLASTHILKPQPSDKQLPMLVANEHFSMSLASRLGLTVAPVSILRVPEPVLVVERFDRIRTAGAVRRLHIVDACQSLNFPVSYKYERNFGSGRDVRDIREGVSFERLFSVVDYTVAKAVTRLALVRWALLQFLIGNADAHGKNVSFFCRPEGLALAPCYDLVSVAQYDGLDHELAMSYGDEFQLEAIGPHDWAEFAHRTGTPRSLLAREMRRMGTLATDAVDLQAAEATYVADEQDFIAGIAKFVRGQAAKLVQMATAMLKVDLA